MVAPFVRHLIAVIACRLQTAVPRSLPGIDPVSALLRPHRIPRAVKQIKLKLRPDQHPVRNARPAHVCLRAQTDIFGILVKGLILPFSDHAHVSAHGQRGDLRKGIHIGRFRIRQKNHVAFLNRRIAVIGAVKPDSLDKSIFPEPFHRNRNMPPPSVDIRHFKINHPNLSVRA